MQSKNDKSKKGKQKIRVRKRQDTGKQKAVEKARPASDKPQFAIVGLGASAGGLEALQRFFKALPDDGDSVAFVLVMHLDPTRESNLPEIIQRHTKLRVRQVTARLEIEPGQVYVIPPDKSLVLTDSHLTVADFERPRGKRTPIDMFFRSLSEAGDRGVAIVMSGGGTDGAVGLRFVKEHGGLIMVQDPNDAQHSSMPNSAIATSVVDFVLPAAELAQEVVKYAKNRHHIRIPEDLQNLPKDDNDALVKILAQLRSHTGHDFSEYKDSTVLRRIGRRMQVNQLESLTEYLRFIRSNPAETYALKKNLLISVTHFFRDEEAWSALAKQVIPNFFSEVIPDQILRVWVPGCATGEEAYSITMLLLEELSKQGRPAPEIQVFATDLDEAALSYGRQGRYPEAIASDVPEKRLRRFFHKQGNHYEVKKEVRERVLFALHGLLKDPPFSRLDLISCRNLLIYMNRDVQMKSIRLFHYGLKPGGYLFLGSAESADGDIDLFRIVDKKHRIYRREETDKPPRLPALEMTGRQASAQFPRTVTRTGEAIPPSGLERHRQILEEQAPPSLIINRNYDLIHLSNSAGRYLQRPGGQPSTQILQQIRPELRADLQACLFEAFEHGRAISSGPIQVAFNDDKRLVHILVQPKIDEQQEQNEALVLFAEVEATGTGHDPGTKKVKDKKVSQLELEVKTLRERLQTTIEEYESSREEMKAANEELQSINEEYKSTGEELETSKEELQSVNEELETLNQELKVKVEELSLSNSALQNLMASTEIGTLFLDRDLRIKRYTPRVSELFSVVPGDVNRRITDLTQTIDYDNLVADAKRVLRDLATVEHEVRSQNDKWFLMRLRPYHTVDDRIEGVVITFVDVTARKQAEKSLHQSQKRLEQELAALRHLHELVARLLVCTDLDTALNEVLLATIDITGADMGSVQLYNAASDILAIVAHHGLAQEYLDRFAVVRASENSACSRAMAGERVIIEDVRKDAQYKRHLKVAEATGYRGVQSTPLTRRTGELIGILSTHYRKPYQPSKHDLRILDLYTRQATDFLERQQGEQTLREVNKRKDEFLAILAHELRNPLATIGTTAVDLQRRTGDERTKESAEVIERQVTHLSRLIDDLLDLSRLNQGKVRLQKKRLEIGEQMLAAVDTVGLFIKQKGHRIKITSPDTPVFVNADPIRLQQIMVNLLHNATKYTDNGGEIEFSAEVEYGFAVCRCRDTGRGLESDELSYLFESFTQIQSESEDKASGLGIGLAIARQLVEAHGGTIAAKSVGRGKGSEFTFRLPLAENRLQQKRASGKTDRKKSMTGKHRILMVEDNEPFADALKTLLEDEGHEVWVVDKGNDTLPAARERKPDVILLDIGLPGKDGHTIARHLREQPETEKITLIAMSGYNEGKRTGLFDSYFVKSHDAEKLLDFIKRLP